MAHMRTEIAGDPLSRHFLKIPRVIGPIPRYLAGKKFGVVFHRRKGSWVDGEDGEAAVPADFRRHPLPNFAFGKRILKDRKIAVRVGIDKPRSHHEFFRLNRQAPHLRRELPDGRDFFAGDSHISAKSLFAAPVDNGAP